MGGSAAWGQSGIVQKDGEGPSQALPPSCPPPHSLLCQELSKFLKSVWLKGGIYVSWSCSGRTNTPVTHSELFGPACPHRTHTRSVVQHHVGPALALPHSANLRTVLSPPHRQGFPQSSGFYLPDALRALPWGPRKKGLQGVNTGQTGGGEMKVLLRRVGKMGKSPRREQQASVTRRWNKLPQGLAVALATPLPTQPASPGNAASWGRKLEPEAKGSVPETPGWVGSVAWTGGL